MEFVTCAYIPEDDQRRAFAIFREDNDTFVAKPLFDFRNASRGPILEFKRLNVTWVPALLWTDTEIRRSMIDRLLQYIEKYDPA